MEEHKANWEDSRRKCVESGGHLTILETEKEKQFVIANFARKSGDRIIYLGASDLRREGVWTWIDGSPVDMKLFPRWEPNNFGGNEHCAAIFGEDFTYMADVGCDQKQARVCEFKNMRECTIVQKKKAMLPNSLGRQSLTP